MAVDYNPEVPGININPLPDNTSNISVTRTPYNETGSFRFWCQKVLPLVYDDSLSYYELLCKVVNFLNEVIENVDNLHDENSNVIASFGALQNYVNANDAAMTQFINASDAQMVDYINSTFADFQTAYNQLQTYVNDYFDNLDVQNEINNKLDDMVDDGTFDTLLAPYMASYQQQLNVLESRLNVLETNYTPGSTTADAELIDIRVGSDDKIYPTAGEGVRKPMSQVSAWHDTPFVLRQGNLQNGTITSTGTSHMYVYIPCLPGHTYRIHKILSKRFEVAFTATEPGDGISYFSGEFHNDDTDVIITAPNNANYLVAYIYNSNVDTISYVIIVNSITFKEYVGYDYYAHNKLNMISVLHTLQVPWEQKVWSNGQKTPSEDRICSFEAVHLQNGDVLSGKCTYPQQFVFAIYDYTGRSLLLDSHWRNEYTYVASSECYVQINSRYLDNSEITVDNNTIQLMSSKPILDIINNNTDEIFYTEAYSVNGHLIVTAGEMENGTFYPEGGGWTYQTNRARCKYHMIPARKGDIVVANKGTDGVQWEVFVVDNPNLGSSTTTLYSSGWVDHLAYECEYDGYYIFLAKGYTSAVTGTITIYQAERNSLPQKHFIDEINDTIATAMSLQTEPCLVFPLLTDIHYGSINDDPQPFLFEKTKDNLKYLASKLRFDATVCLGDITEGTFTKETQILYGSRVSNSLRNIGAPYLLAVGNHDDNRYGRSATLTSAELYETFISYTDNNVVFNANTNGRDFYLDYPNYKTRIICLDSNNNGAYGYPNNCVTWFTNVALNTPDNYLAVVLTHIAPISSHNYDNKSVTNGSNIASAIEAYQTNGKPIIELYGHSHADVAFTSPYLSIGTNCSKFENENGDPSLWPEGATKPTRTQGTATEDCFDIVIVRFASRKINLVRFGAGDNREYSW